MRKIMKKRSYFRLNLIHQDLGLELKSRRRISMGRLLELIEEMHEVLIRHDSWERSRVRESGVKKYGRQKKGRKGT